MEADKKVTFEEDDKQKEETYTYFEELVARVDELERVLENHASILRQNNLKFTSEENAESYDADNVYKALVE